MALNTIVEQLNQYFLYKGFLNKRVLYGLGIAGLIAFGISGFMGYRWYRVYRAQAAQKRLSECIKEYVDGAKGRGEGGGWSFIAALCKDAGQQYADTALAPLFLAYQAQALLKDNKLPEAYEVMNQVMKLMPRTHELYSLYELKTILMAIDLSETDTRIVLHDKVQRLVELAQDRTNKQRDMALFYAGRYYWAHDDMVKAKEFLQELVAFSHTDGSATNPWVEKSVALMQQVVV